MSQLKVGDAAPDFTGVNEKGESISLSDYKGKKLILFFYPKDNFCKLWPLFVPLIFCTVANPVCRLQRTRMVHAKHIVKYSCFGNTELKLK